MMTALHGSKKIPSNHAFKSEEELKSPEPKHRNYIFFEIEILTRPGSHGRGACPQANGSCRKSPILMFFGVKIEFPMQNVAIPSVCQNGNVAIHLFLNRDLPLLPDFKGIRTFHPESETRAFEFFFRCPGFPLIRTCERLQVAVRVIFWHRLLMRPLFRA